MGSTMRISQAGVLCSLILAGLMGGQAHAHGLRLSAETEGDRIVGEARYIDQTPLVGVSVQLHRTDQGESDAEIGWQSATDAQGAFRFQNLPPGHYQLRLNDGLGHQAKVQLELTPSASTSRVWSSAAPWQLRDLVAGLGYIVGIFGLLSVWMSRRRSRV
jgi:hypothetical protein